MLINQMKTMYGTLYSVNTSRSIDSKNLDSVIQLGYQNTSLYLRGMNIYLRNMKPISRRTCLK